jgi:hypothetical protein
MNGKIQFLDDFIVSKILTEILNFDHAQLPRCGEAFL